MTINDIPKNYPLYIVKDCPMANSCLRQLAMQVQNTKQRLLTIVNPKCITASGLISMLMLKDITGMTKQKIVISMLFNPFAIVLLAKDSSPLHQRTGVFCHKDYEVQYK